MGVRRPNPAHISGHRRSRAGRRVSVQTLIFSVVAKTPSDAISSLQGGAMGGQPAAKSLRIRAYSRPVPSRRGTECAIYIPRQTPAGSPILPKVHRKEHQPESFIKIAPSIVQHGSFQRVEKIARWIRTQRADITCADQVNVFYPMDTFDKLLNEGAGTGRTSYPREPEFLLIECLQRRCQLPREICVFRCHRCAVAARVIQRRMAPVTLFVTPKLL